MKQKLFTFFLALITSVAALYASNTRVGGIYYDFDNTNNTAIVTYRGSSYNDYSDEYSGTVVIPSSVTYNGTTYSVTSIEKYAFWYCSSLTSVTIGESVTSIGEYAFRGCSSLTSVTIGESVTSIGEDAFYSCSSLTSVTIPNSVTSIGYAAFRGCSSLTSVTINSDAIVNKQYSSDSNLSHIFGSQVTEYVIGDNVIGIGEYAFKGCSSLTSVTINSDAIVNKQYSSDSNLSHIFGSQVTEYIIGESVTSIGKGAFRNCSSLTSVTIGESVTSIGEFAFYSCSSLTSITIPNSVTSIEKYAFYSCSSLTSVTIGESVTSIGEYAFYGYYSLTSITCEAATPPTIGGIYTFYGVSKSIPVYVPCGCVGTYKAASGWEDFTNIQEPLAEYSIEVYVNYNIMGTAKVNYNTFCEGSQISATPNFGYHFVQWSDGNTDAIRTLELTQDTILTAEFAQSFSGQCGDSLYWELVDTTLHITGKGEMYDYKSNTAPWKLLVGSIKVLTIAEDVTKLSLSFGSCSVLESVVWNARHAADAYSDGQSVYPIFYDIRSHITSFTFGEAVEYIPTFLCSGCYKLTSVTIPNSVTSIGSSAFYDCSSLTSVTIGESVTSIGNSAFNGCSSLTSVTIPNSVTSIGNSAFNRCSSLTSVTIPNSVTNIEAGAFNRCSSLTSVTIPNSVTSIGNSAFNRCSSLTSVTIPNSVTSIGNSAFNGCSSLTSVTIGESVTSIGSSAFFDCSSLTSVTIGNSVTSIGEYAFRGCSSLTSVTIPNSVTSIGEYAFWYCSSLTSVTIGESVTSIGNSAFRSCSSLTSITCDAENPPIVGSYAFYDVSRSIPVYVPCGCVEAYKSDNGWNYFTNIREPLAEYSIEVYVNDFEDGYAKVDKNNACGSQISATPNFGYHFVQWSDRNTDNPRTLELTQDTILIAEFAPNTYTITTVSSDTQRGTTQGDTTVNYLEYITISASASYGYHFVQWNDGNSDNPRQVRVTGNTTYTATFDKNTYAISLSCNEEQGSVEGVTSAKYLDTVTISATPNIGYHFVQWSDGNTDAIRTLELTQDTTLIAEFAQSFSGQCGDSLYWELVDTTLHITGKGEMYDYKPDSAPWKLLVSSIKVLTIAEDVTKIGYDAFDGCTALVTIVWNAKHAADAYNDGQSVYPIFYGIRSQIKSFTLGENVEYIPTYLCDGMDKLTSMTIPNSVTSIGNWAFDGCTSLTSVTIPESVTSIGKSAFEGCSAIDSIVWNARHAADAYSDGQYVYPIFYEIRSQIKSFTLGENVEYIPTYLCYGMDKLTSMTIPNSVTSIGDYAFRGCSSLTSVTFPESVTSIGKSAFEGCSTIDSIVWNAKNCADASSLETAPFYAIRSQITSFTFGENVEHIPAYLCDGMDKLTSMTIPNSVTSIGGAAFYSCSSLTSLTIGKSVTSIGTCAFQDCSSLTSVTTPNSLKTIGTSAFEGCARLGKISLGTGLEEIAANAFAGCTRLYDIYVYATYPPFAEKSSFANYNVYVYIPCEYQRDYILDVVWGEFKFIECIESEDVTTDGVLITPSTNDVTITWPTEGNADTYTIVIKKGDTVFCTLTFNADGQLLNIAFAPGRDGNNRPAQYAEQAGNGYRFTVTGLTEATQYAYNITTKDAANKTIATYSGEFTTMGDTTTDMDNIQSPMTNCQKILRNGQLLIIRDGVEYTIMGQEL